MSPIMTPLRTLFACAGACAIAAFGAPVAAHHSAAAYLDASIEIAGATITNVVWANPHTIISFDVKEGERAGSWNSEAGSPSAQTRMGWSRNSLRPGDQVTVTLFPARNGAKVGRLSHVIFADGTELLDSQSTRERPGQ
jgi:hypothetical protein